MFGKKFSKISIILSFALAIMLIMTGCGGSSEKSQSGDNANKETGSNKDTINYAISGEPSTLDPHMISDNIATGIFNQIFDKLIRLEADGSLTPGLAESWEMSEDGTEMKLKIRDGVKFHNGEELTTEDVAYSLNRAIESKFTQDITSAMDHAEVVDDDTVVLKFKYSYGPAEACIARIFIVNKKAVESDPEGFGRNPVGTGAYKFVDLKSGDKIICERFEDYYRGEAPIKNLVFKIIIDPSTAALALENGEVDLLSQPSMEDRERLMENEKVQYHETELLGNNYIAFNNTEGLFKDKKLRQAIAHAVDKESMLIGAIEGAGVVVDNAIPRDCYGYSDKVTGYEYDPEKAKELLAEAGYPDGLSIQLKTMDSATYYKPTEVLQDQLREIGIDAEIQKMERGAYLTDVYENADYDMTVMSMVYSITDADAVYAFFHSDMIKNGQNFFKCDIPELDELLDKGRTSSDQEERKEIYEKVGQMLNDECVLVPLYAYNVGVAADKNLKGVQASAIQFYEVFSYSW